MPDRMPDADPPSSLRAAPGSYALVLRASRSATVEVGALGTLDVVPGTYVYAGSAFGSGGVRARVRRHARSADAKTLHWHVDFVRAATALDRVWVTYDAVRRECDWARLLRALPGATTPLDGFGASDCACTTHLVRFDTPPRLDAVRDRLPPDHAPVRVWTPDGSPA